MENLSLSLVLIALAGVHIAEEAIRNFRYFFNIDWFNGNEDCPVGQFKGLFLDKIGLFVLLTVCSLAGAWIHGSWILIAVGVITADLLQHTLFSIGTRRYTPGIATSVLYLLYVIYFFTQGEPRKLLTLEWSWVALGGGAAFIVGNYLYAWWKVQKGDCQSSSA